LAALSGVDERDPITLTNKNTQDFISALDKNGLKGAKLGVPCDPVFYEGLSDEKSNIFEDSVEKLKQLGAEIKEVEIPAAKVDWGYDVLTYEFKPDLNAYLNQLHPSVKVRNLTQLIAFNKHHLERTLKYGQAVLLESEATSGTLTEKQYLQALEHDQYMSKEQGIDYTLNKYDVSALVFPHDHGSAIAAIAGYPSITVPAGYSADGEPFGITFTGTAYSESTLIPLAYGFEQATKIRKPPVLEVDGKA
jgi:amidase